MYENTKKTILAIDDSVTSLATLRTILEGTYEVCLAKSADIAKTILDTVKIDLILLDMEMPEMSGLEFQKYLGRHPKYYRIPVIFVSSHGRAEVIVQVTQAGARDFVVKPVSPVILLEKVEAILKAVPVKTSIGWELLTRKLSHLEDACKQGKSTRIDELREDIESVRFNRTVDVALAEICRYAKKMDYDLVIKKIKELAAIRPSNTNE